MATIKGFSVQRPKVYIKYWKGPEEEIHTQTPSQNYYYTHTYTHTQSKREVFGSGTAPNLHSKDLVV